MPVGDGDREPDVRQAALGVQRAVDRVDDDVDVVAAEVDDAALLADRAEARARVVQPLELGEDAVLGLLVDDERAVAALAALAGLLDALAARRVVAQHLAQAVGGPAAGAEPVRRPEPPGNAPLAHTIGGCPRGSTSSPRRSGVR